MPLHFIKGTLILSCDFGGSYIIKFITSKFQVFSTYVITFVVAVYFRGLER